MPNEFGGSWTEDKLLVMRSYFAGYAQALKNQPFAKWYVDAFAGSGERTDAKSTTPIVSLFGDDQVEVAQVKQGSVRIALGIDPPFARYVLIEQAEEHIVALEQLRTEFPDRQIDVLTGDANETLRNFCKSTNWYKTRAAVFIDPYGMQVDWTTLQALAGTKAVDIALLFPTGPLNRMLAGHGNLPDEWVTRIDNHLGPCDWRSACYELVRVDDLFSSGSTKVERTVTVDGLRAFVLERLRTLFPHVCEKQLELRNSKNSILYHLFIICANPSPKAGGVAMRIARGAMSLKPKRS